MNITVLAVGKIRESYFTDAIREYTKRLSRYTDVKIIEVPDEPAPDSLSAAQIRQVKEREGAGLLARVPGRAYRIALCIDGKRMDSIRFSQHLCDCMTGGYSSIVFFIGGSNGLSDEVIRSAHLCMSFSDLTFPHQLMRLILLEQVYRAFKIMHHEPYHK